jgi:hypothetical protein
MVRTQEFVNVSAETTIEKSISTREHLIVWRVLVRGVRASYAWRHVNARGHKA